MKEFFVEELILGSQSIRLADDQIVCVVGPNSSGKSALLEKLRALILNANPGRPSILSDLRVAKSYVKDEVLSLLNRVAKVGERKIAFRSVQQ
jgi:ABC-type cobalamin/Fe3+-siderophores transport system ATPase subunit